MADPQKTKELNLTGYEVESVSQNDEWKIELSPFPSICPKCGAPLETHALRSGMSQPLDVLLPPDEQDWLTKHKQITLELKRHKFLCAGCIRDKNGHKVQIDVGYRHTFVNKYSWQIVK